MKQQRIKIAIQKSGRLQAKSVSLLQECGLKFSNGPNRLKTESYNFPADILFLRDDDIPQYVEDGVADIGVVGENVVLEKKKDINIVERLDFAKCRLSLAIPKSEQYKGIKSFDGKRIATSYPNIIQQFLQKNNIKAEIHEISGSVEIAPSIGLADAICDIVSTGSTLMSNGLKEVETVIRSEAVLVSGKLSTDVQAILDKLLFRIKAVKKAKNTKYMLLNAPNDKIEAITNVLPGMKSPTVMPLKESGWSSIHSVVEEDEFWEKIDELKDNGAQGILVVPIEKMIL
ncbi:MAG: ATP phosphoribosyltransferase [Fulvivirga sp.]|nr:ATP phosphoribosyltransferase [Fulvivirga sp.]